MFVVVCFNILKSCDFRKEKRKEEKKTQEQMPLEEGEVVSSDYSDTEERRKEHRRDKRRDEKESSRHRSSSHHHHHHHHHRSSSKSRHDDDDKHRSSHRHREDSSSRNSSSSSRSKGERSHSRHHSRSSEEPPKKLDKLGKSALSIESKVPEVEEGEVIKHVTEGMKKDEKLSPPATKKIAIDVKENVNHETIKETNNDNNNNNNDNINNNSNDNNDDDDDFDMFEKKGPSIEEIAAQRRERIRQIKERFKKLEEEKCQQQDESTEGGKELHHQETPSSSLSLLSTQASVQDSHTPVGIPNNSSTLITLGKPAVENKLKESVQDKVNKDVQIDLFAIDSDDDEDDNDNNHLGKAPIPSISPSLSVRETADTFNDSEGYYSK